MKAQISSWGGFPAVAQYRHGCYWRDDLQQQVARLRDQHQSLLPFGNGRSYGDSCLAASDHLLSLRGLDRLIGVDWDRGRVIAESGLSLRELIEVILPNGWFLPVTPGTAEVTLGGAVANDVHGKNHHLRGSFGHHLLGFGLYRSDSGHQWCSAETQPELFAATVGGLGLSGIITHVELQLMPISSNRLSVRQQRFGSLGEFIALSAELDSRHEYSVAWLDCLARGRQTGRGIFMVADHAPCGELRVERAARPGVPFTPPLSLVNGLSIRAFNMAYWHRAPATPREQHVGYDRFFYPLDGIANWNRMYGPRGFQQYQCVIPHAHAETAIHAMLQEISGQGAGSFLAVLKRCGGMPSTGYLSFPMPGVSLALDFPQNASLSALFNRLDCIVHEAGGRLYPAKDAHMSGEHFRHAYPDWEKVESLRDRALQSRFWQRVMQ